MFIRSGLVSLVVAAVSSAKPPGLPADPHIDGREPPPVDRDFHRPVAPLPAAAVVALAALKWA